MLCYGAAKVKSLRVRIRSRNPNSKNIREQAVQRRMIEVGGQRSAVTAETPKSVRLQGPEFLIRERGGNGYAA